MKHYPSELAAYADLDREKLRAGDASVLCSYGYRRADIRRSSARFDGMRFGEIDVLHHFAQGLKGTFRSVRQIQEDETDAFLFALPLSSAVRISQSGRTSIVTPGSCFVVNTKKLCNVMWDVSAESTYMELVARIPGPLLRRHVPYVDQCCAKSILTTRGAGKVMRSLMECLLEEKDNLLDTQARRFGSVLIDTVSNALLEAPELLDLQSPRRQSARTVVFEAATSFIEANLSNPNLDTRLVARHCGISVSYLHACFAACSENVASLIRNLRLERCREALRSPSLRHQSILEVALRWGFVSSSSFNHAYQARYGMAPSVARKTYFRETHDAS